MNIVQIKKIFHNGELINKECRLIEYESLNGIDYLITNDKREVYRDKYLTGYLSPIRPNILAKEINDNELLYVIQLFNKDIMLNRFIKF